MNVFIKIALVCSVQYVMGFAPSEEQKQIIKSYVKEQYQADIDRINIIDTTIRQYVSGENCNTEKKCPMGCQLTYIPSAFRQHLTSYLDLELYEKIASRWFTSCKKCCKTIHINKSTEFVRHFKQCKYNTSNLDGNALAQTLKILALQNLLQTYDPEQYARAEEAVKQGKTKKKLLQRTNQSI